MPSNIDFTDTEILRHAKNHLVEFQNWVRPLQYKRLFCTAPFAFLATYLVSAIDKECFCKSFTDRP